MNSDFKDDNLNHIPGPLLNHEPRAGFKQRFWVRVETKPDRAKSPFKWLLLGSALIGMVIGFGIPFLNSSKLPLSVKSIGEIEKMSGLPLGSLTQTVLSEGANR